MTSTLVRGKYIICKVTGPNSAEAIVDVAFYQLIIDSKGFGINFL